MLLGSTWSSRGWAFQEQLSSSRKIIIQNDTVNWDCYCTAWHETQADLGILARQPCSTPLGPYTTGFDTTVWPDFHRFSRLVSIYNKRHLTFEAEVLDAFAGALNVSWPECSRYDGVYQFYNVMCIEWKDGIAYRKAVGRVVDHVSERIATEMIEVTIG